MTILITRLSWSQRNMSRHALSPLFVLIVAFSCVIFTGCPQSGPPKDDGKTGTDKKDDQGADAKTNDKEPGDEESTNKVPELTPEEKAAQQKAAEEKAAAEQAALKLETEAADFLTGKGWSATKSDAGHVLTADLTSSSVPYPTAEDLDRLADLPHLQQLKLTSPSITSDVMKVVGKLSDLRRLSIEFTKVNDEGIGHLATARLQIVTLSHIIRLAC